MDWQIDRQADSVAFNEGEKPLSLIITVSVVENIGHGYKGYDEIMHAFCVILSE
jgi:hypothetical protein